MSPLVIKPSSPNATSRTSLMWNPGHEAQLSQQRLDEWIKWSRSAAQKWAIVSSIRRWAPLLILCQLNSRCPYRIKTLPLTSQQSLSERRALFLDIGQQFVTRCSIGLGVDPVKKEKVFQYCFQTALKQFRRYQHSKLSTLLYDKSADTIINEISWKLTKGRCWSNRELFYWGEGNIWIQKASFQPWQAKVRS